MFYRYYTDGETLIRVGTSVAGESLVAAPEPPAPEELQATSTERYMAGQGWFDGPTGGHLAADGSNFRLIEPHEAIRMQVVLDGTVDTSGEPEGGWLYFAGRGTLVRVPALDKRPLAKRRGQRYWGRGSWFGASPGCIDPATNLSPGGGFQEIDEGEVTRIADQLGNQPGGVFRDGGRFWPDQADLWTVERARRRATELDAETGPDSSHWTMQEYFDDVHELERLQEFIDERR